MEIHNRFDMGDFFMLPHPGDVNQLIEITGLKNTLAGFVSYPQSKRPPTRSNVT
jgi:hypothetical protein